VTGGPAPEDFLSGQSGEVSGLRLTTTRTAGDAVLDLLERARGTARRLDRLAETEPARRVLVLSAYRPLSAIADTVAALRSDRHRVTLALGATGEPDPAVAEGTVAQGLTGGKFENLNRVLETSPPPEEFDWTIVVDDDVALPPRFLDRFLGLCGRFGLDMAQPAQTLRSHSAWRVTKRRPLSALRETRFVEIGPVTAFRRPAAAELLPFPAVRFGWGLDLHWAAVAGERGWRLGIADALPVRHASAPVAAAYGHAEAIEEGRRFLADRPFLRSAEAQETLAVHRRVPSP
jgi:hypothetical protein